MSNTNTAGKKTRGQMVHKQARGGGGNSAERDTFVELELTEDGSIQPHQLLFLLERIKQNSVNFERSGEVSSPLNNKAHMFIKLHFWHENLTVSSMTIVDMAGYPLRPKASEKLPKNHLNAYTDKYSELNSQGINYLLYVFKDMIFKESQKDRQ